MQPAILRLHPRTRSDKCRASRLRHRKRRAQRIRSETIASDVRRPLRDCLDLDQGHRRPAGLMPEAWIIRQTKSRFNRVWVTKKRTPRIFVKCLRSTSATFAR